MSDDEGILRPEDLRLDDDRVRTLDDGRLVVSTGEEPASTGSESRGPSEESPTMGADPAPTSLVDALPDEQAYELAVAARGDHGTAETAIGSNDIRESFSALVRWYAAQVEPELPAEDVLATLIEASDLALSVERRE